jgi:Protein of unknown function (DUF2804)
VKGDLLNMEVAKGEGSLNFGLKATEADKSKSRFNLNFQFKTSNSESQLWVTPLSNDLTEYFATSKKLALTLEGSYTVNNKEFTCGTKKDDCLITLDFGRGAFNYGVAYYWALF